MKQAIKNLQKEKAWLLKYIKTKPMQQDPYDIVKMAEKLKRLESAISYLEMIS